MLIDPFKPAAPARPNILSPAPDEVRPALPQPGATGNGEVWQLYLPPASGYRQDQSWAR